MKRKTGIRLISFFCAGILAAGGLALQQHHRAESALRSVRYAGDHAFEELCAAVSGMETAMEKAVRTGESGMLCSLCAEIFARAGVASTALSALPGTYGGMEETAGFFSRVGDYALYLLRKTAGGQPLTEEESGSLAQLSTAAGVFCDNLSALRADRRNGLISTGEAAIGEALPTLTDSLLQMEQEFPETPSLVYDGPFSASVADRTPRMLEGAREIGEGAAQRIAAAYLGADAGELHVTGGAEGRIPTWRLTAGEHTVSVTKAGGYVIRDISSRIPDETLLTPEEAVQKALDFLSSYGYDGMEETYHLREGAMLTAVFCYAWDGVTFYPDMIKVTVALDNGEILRTDFEPYLTSHGERTLPEVRLTEEEAAQNVPAGYTLLSQNLALIPSAGEEERLCRELVCEDEEGGHCLLYHNVETGNQEKILLLLEDETGTLSR